MLNLILNTAGLRTLGLELVGVSVDFLRWVGQPPDMLLVTHTVNRWKLGLFVMVLCVCIL